MVFGFPRIPNSPFASLANHSHASEESEEERVRRYTAKRRVDVCEHATGLMVRCLCDTAKEKNKRWVIALYAETTSCRTLTLKRCKNTSNHEDTRSRFG